MKRQKTWKQSDDGRWRLQKSTHWRISAFGWRHGEPCSEEQLRADTWSAALKKTMEFAAGHPARNRRITVTVPNTNLRHPRRDAGSETPVSSEFITEALDRMELVPEAENGACAPADWQLPLGPKWPL